MSDERCQAAAQAAQHAAAAAHYAALAAQAAAVAAGASSSSAQQSPYPQAPAYGQNYPQPHAMTIPTFW